MGRDRLLAVILRGLLPARPPACLCSVDRLRACAGLRCSIAMSHFSSTGFLISRALRFVIMATHSAAWPHGTAARIVAFASSPQPARATRTIKARTGRPWASRRATAKRIWSMDAVARRRPQRSMGGDRVRRGAITSCSARCFDADTGRESWWLAQMLHY